MVSLRAHLARRRRLGAVLTGMAVLSATPAETRAEFLDAWLAHQAHIRTWSADFTQTRALRALTQPLTVRGRVWFAAPDRFRWELREADGTGAGDPEPGQTPLANRGDPLLHCQTIAVRGAEQLLVIYPKLKRAERYPLTGRQPGPWRDALALLESGFPRSRVDLEAKFRVLSVSDIAGRCDVTLQPKAASARKLMPQLRLAFATNDFSLQWTELKFADGSTLRNEFTNACVNPELDEGMFTPTLEPVFTVVEPPAGRAEAR